MVKWLVYWHNVQLALKLLKPQYFVVSMFLFLMLYFQHLPLFIIIYGYMANKKEAKRLMEEGKKWYRNKAKKLEGNSDKYLFNEWLREIT